MSRRRHSPREYLQGTLGRIDRWFDKRRHARRRRRGYSRPVRPRPYRGHGTVDLVHVRGRVLEDRGGPPRADPGGGTAWQNIKTAANRFLTREVANARLRVRLGDDERVVEADREGYFDVRLHPTNLDPDTLWHRAEVELLEPVSDPEAARASATVIVPPRSARFGVISDVDDTIVVTEATSLLRMTQLTFLRSAASRLPFAGVSAFYRALVGGSSGADGNPVFYLSSSPWNLYDFFVEMLDVHGLPKGPLLLRDLGVDESKLIKSTHSEHKLGQIELLLETHHDLPFVLVGDSGQKDAEIYREVAGRWPDRLEAIYIRDVGHDARHRRVRELAAEVEALGVPMICVPDTLAAARHAVGLGLMRAEELPAVEEDRRHDEGEPTTLEHVVGVDRD